MNIKLINRLIGFGMVSVMGLVAGLVWTEYFRFLIPIGLLIALAGVFCFFKYTNLAEQFRKHPGENVLIYFWNVIFLKLWVAIFLIYMIAVNITLFFHTLL